MPDRTVIPIEYCQLSSKDNTRNLLFIFGIVAIVIYILYCSFNTTGAISKQNKTGIKIANPNTPYPDNIYYDNMQQQYGREYVTPEWTINIPNHTNNYY